MEGAVNTFPLKKKKKLSRETLSNVPSIGGRYANVGRGLLPRGALIKNESD